MKHPFAWMAAILFGIAAVLVMTRLVSGGPAQPDRQEVALDLKPVEDVADTETSPAGEPNYEFEMTETVGGLTRLTGEGVTLVVPQDWIIEAGIGEVNSGDPFIDDKREILIRLQNVEDDEMTDPDVVSLDIERIAKNGRAYSEVVRDWSWTADDAESQAKSMGEAASEPFNQITAADIVIEAGTLDLGGQTVAYSAFVCTKPCYIEGNPPALKRYFFDAEDAVYTVFVHAVAGAPDEAGLMAQAAEIAATFKILPN